MGRALTPHLSQGVRGWGTGVTRASGGAGLSLDLTRPSLQYSVNRQKLQPDVGGVGAGRALGETDKKCPGQVTRAQRVAK